MKLGLKLKFRNYRPKVQVSLKDQLIKQKFATMSVNDARDMEETNRINLEQNDDALTDKFVSLIKKKVTVNYPSSFTAFRQPFQESNDEEFDGPIELVTDPLPKARRTFVQARALTLSSIEFPDDPIDLNEDRQPSRCSTFLQNYGPAAKTAKPSRKSPLPDQPTSKIQLRLKSHHVKQLSNITKAAMSSALSGSHMSLPKLSSAATGRRLPFKNIK